MTVLLLTGILIFLLFLLPVFTGLVFNIGNAGGMLAGILLIAVSQNMIVLPVWCWVILAVLALYAVFLSVRMISACAKKPSGTETAVVLGCEVIGERPSLMLSGRMEAALGYLQKYPETSAVLCGGRGRTEMISEAEAMYRYLTAHGISEDRLYREGQSVSTRENLHNAAAIIQENGLNSECAIVTNEFHIYRSSLIAEDEGLGFRAVCAPSPWWLLLTFWMREFFAVTAMYIFGH